MKVKRANASIMTIYKEDSYTLETLPETINYNQFYCYSTYSGKIFIGTIIGKSALRPYYKYEINERTYEIYEKDAFSEEKNNIAIRDTNLLAFLNYQDFLKSYNDYVKSKEVKKKVQRKRVIRYMVNTETFECKTTTIEKPYYRNKLFDTKDEAITYATKGLKRLAKKAESLTKTMSEQLKLLSQSLSKESYAYINCYGVSLEKYLEEMMAKPSNLKEGDTLAKINYAQYKNFNTKVIDKDYSTTVKSIVSPGNVVLLSDNTLLYEGECKAYCVPLLVKAEAVNTVMVLLKKSSTRKIIEQLERELLSLEKIAKYAKEYVPFKKNAVTPLYFSVGYIADIAKDVEDFIKDNNLKNG